MLRSVLNAFYFTTEHNHQINKLGIMTGVRHKSLDIFGISLYVVIDESKKASCGSGVKKHRTYIINR